MWLFIFWVLFLLYVGACAFLILVVLNQEPKGAGVGAMFGQGSAMGDALGVAGMQRTLRTWTRNAATIFAVLSIVLALVGGKAFDQGVLPPAAPPPAASAEAPALTEAEIADLEKAVADAAEKNAAAPTATEGAAPAAE